MPDTNIDNSTKGVNTVKRLTYELANILCWYRIVISVILAVMPKMSIILAILFALAFISDALDGWCYRQFTKDRPYQHWFNRFPITMDPIADFFLVGGGIIHVMDDKLWGAYLVAGMAALMLLWNWLGHNAKNLAYTILMTVLTYYWFAMMVVAVVVVWCHDGGPYWLVGLIVTVVVFYLVWFKTRDKTRSIRRRG